MKIKTFILILVSTQFSWGKVQLSTQGSQAVSASVVESFHLNNLGYKQYGALVTLTESDLIESKELSSENGFIIKDDQQVKWLVTSFSDQLFYKNKNGEDLIIKAEWLPDRNKLMSEQCKKNSAQVTLKNKKQVLPFPLGISCDNSGKVLKLTLSVPSEVEWQDSTLFEAAGKGEAWRSYEIPSSSPNGSVIGTITLKFKDENFDLDIVAPKSVDYSQKEQIDKIMKDTTTQFQQTLYFGTLAVKFAAGSQTAEDSKYSLKYSALSAKYFKDIRFGGEFKTGLALSPSDQSIDVMAYNFHTGYYWQPNQRLNLGGRLLFGGIDLQQKATTAKFQSTQAGYGAYADYLANPKSRVLFKLNMMGLGSKVIKSHLEYGLEYRYQINLSNINYWVGLSYNDETYKAENETGSSREIKLNEIQLSLGF